VRTDAQSSVDPSLYIPPQSESPAPLESESEDELELPQMSVIDMLPFKIDYTVLSKKLRFKVDVKVLSSDGDSSWRKTSVPSHASWVSIRTFLLDQMDLPRSKHTGVKLIYQLGEAKGTRFELQHDRDWVDIRKELREHLEDKRKRVKKKLPLFIQASVVSE
jgi:hypothetical protein